MSPKARRLKGRIPRSARFRASVRKWAGSLWRDLRKKPATTKAGKNDPWPICPLCDRQKPPWIFGQCDEHPDSCGCCLYSLHRTPPQGGARQRKKPPASKFKPGDPASEKAQHAARQAQHQAEIEEQCRQEAEGQERSNETADAGTQESNEGGGEE